MPKPAMMANAMPIGTVDETDNTRPATVTAPKATTSARSRPKMRRIGVSGRRPSSWQNPRNAAMVDAVPAVSPSEVIVGTWYTSIVAIATPPNAIAAVKSRVSARSTVAIRIWRIGVLGRVDFTGAGAGNSTAATAKDPAPAAARMRTVARQSSASTSQAVAGRKIADAKAPQIVSRVIARGPSWLRRTTVGMVTW